MAIQWPLVIFSLLAGCGGATFAFTGLSEALNIGKNSRIPAAVAALVFLIIGGCASVLHLGQPNNIMAAATNIFSFSGISVELILLGINVVLVAAYLVTAKREEAKGASRIIGIIGIVTGCALAFAVGNGYVIEAQVNWNTIALPLGYLGSGLAMGGTLFAAIMVAVKEDIADIKRIDMFVLGTVVLQVIAFLAYGAVIGFAGDALLYWGGAIIVGSVATLVCVVMTPKVASLAYGAFVCAFIGGVAFRALMWTLGFGFLNLFATAAARGVLGI